MGNIFGTLGMAAKRNEHKPRVTEADIKHADRWVQLGCVVGLIATIAIDAYTPGELNSLVYYIWGFGILGKEVVQFILPGGRR